MIEWQFLWALCRIKCLATLKNYAAASMRCWTVVGKMMIWLLVVASEKSVWTHHSRGPPSFYPVWLKIMFSCIWTLAASMDNHDRADQSVRPFSMFAMTTMDPSTFQSIRLFSAVRFFRSTSVPVVRPDHRLKSLHCHFHRNHNSSHPRAIPFVPNQCCLCPMDSMWSSSAATMDQESKGNDRNIVKLFEALRWY